MTALVVRREEARELGARVVAGARAAAGSRARLRRRDEPVARECAADHRGVRVVRHEHSCLDLRALRVRRPASGGSCDTFAHLRPRRAWPGHPVARSGLLPASRHPRGPSEAETLRGAPAQASCDAASIAGTLRASSGGATTMAFLPVLSRQRLPSDGHHLSGNDEPRRDAQRFHFMWLYRLSSLGRANPHCLTVVCGSQRRRPAS